jgi:hypothetical protein
MFCLREMNNGILNATKAMPLKDLTSNNDSTFAINRKQYIRVLNDTVTVQQLQQKKWYGNSSVRDSTKVMQKKVRNEIGNGTLNSSKSNMAFVDTNIRGGNIRRNALTRVRNLGSSVPAKKTHNYNNAPIFY